MLLFSGAALVAHIVSGVSLRLALAATTTVMVLVSAIVWHTARIEARRTIARVAKAGILSGALATLAYDASKFVLSHLDSALYNPFEAIGIFGTLLVGPSAGPIARYLAGAAFHLLNGVSFGIAFCFLFSGRGVLAGIGWGLFLEVFQLTLYPGWLNVRLYREFVQISVLSHVAYGAVLARCCQALLRPSSTSTRATARSSQP